MMISEKRRAGPFYALQMMRGMDCTTPVNKSLAINGKA